METRMLKNFLRLAENLNYRKTAEEVFIAQPALSRQIQQMEETLGAVLFDRDKRNVRLTPAGVYFKKEVERLLNQWEETCRKTAEIYRGEAGEIRIGHASSAMQSILPKLVVKLREQMPNLHTLLAEITNLQMVSALQNRQVDIAFGPNIIPPADLSSKLMYCESFVIILPESHPLNADTFTDLSSLKCEKFIIPPYGEGIGYVETLHRICQEHGGFLPQTIHESASTASVLRLVEAGIGISMEPYSSICGHNLRIKYIELAHVAQKAEMKMLWLTERTDELQPILGLLESTCRN